VQRLVREARMQEPPPVPKKGGRRGKKGAEPDGSPSSSSSGSVDKSKGKLRVKGGSSTGNGGGGSGDESPDDMPPRPGGRAGLPDSDDDEDYNEEGEEGDELAELGGGGGSPAAYTGSAYGRSRDLSFAVGAALGILAIDWEQVARDRMALGLDEGQFTPRPEGDGLAAQHLIRRAPQQPVAAPQRRFSVHPQNENVCSICTKVCMRLVYCSFSLQHVMTPCLQLLCFQALQHTFMEPKITDGQAMVMAARGLPGAQAALRSAGRGEKVEVQRRRRSVIELGCRHAFCKGCLVRWAKMCDDVAPCPLCRAPLPPSVVVEARPSAPQAAGAYEHQVAFELGNSHELVPQSARAPNNVHRWRCFLGLAEGEHNTLDSLRLLNHYVRKVEFELDDVFKDRKRVVHSNPHNPLAMAIGPITGWYVVDVVLCLLCLMRWFSVAHPSSLQGLVCNQDHDHVAPGLRAAAYCAQPRAALRRRGRGAQV